MPKPIIVTPQTPLEELPQFLTVDEWRTFMRIGRSSAYDLIRQGLVPVVRCGRTVRISREVVMRLVNHEGDESKNASRLPREASDGYGVRQHAEANGGNLHDSTSASS